MSNDEAPPKSTNVEIGDRLKAERQRLGHWQADFAVLAGVSKTTQFNYESGERMPDALYLAKAHAAGANIMFIITGENPTSTKDEYVMIPVLPVKASAGNGAVNEAPASYTTGGLCFSRDWLTRRKLSTAKLAVITVRGSSMEGVLSNGDQVLVDQQDTQPRSGFVYVLRQGDELLVKYCQLLPGGLLRVSSANTTYAPYDVDLSRTPDVEIIGRVVASMHEW